MNLNRLKSPHLKIISFLVLFSLPFLFFYQNCGDSVRFSDVNELNKINDTNNSGQQTNNPPPVDPPPVDPSVVICDPFTDPMGCETAIQNKAGLIGDIYYLDDSSLVHLNGSYSNAQLADYINYGKKISNPLLLTIVNVQPRAWDSGFPVGDSFLKKESGDKLIEWFGIDVKGRIRAPSENLNGLYQFATLSDDGTIIKIDNQTVIDDDSLHSPRWKCSDKAVELNFSEPKSIQLGYYQGPRVDIAMVVYYRPWDQRQSPCSSNGGFTVVPAEAYLQ